MVRTTKSTIQCSLCLVEVSTLGLAYLHTEDSIDFQPHLIWILKILGAWETPEQHPFRRSRGWVVVGGGTLNPLSFYRTQVYLGSDLWVQVSARPSLTLLTELMCLWFMKIPTQF